MTKQAATIELVAASTVGDHRAGDIFTCDIEEAHALVKSGAAKEFDRDNLSPVTIQTKALEFYLKAAGPSCGYLAVQNNGQITSVTHSLNDRKARGELFWASYDADCLSIFHKKEIRKARFPMLVESVKEEIRRKGLIAGCEVVFE